MTSVGSLSAIPTWRFKLPRVGKYTAFEIKVEAQRYADRADADLVYPIESEISKIELVEGGSRALLSLTGSQLDASNYFSFGRPNARRYRQAAATGNQIHLFILGGRSLYDREYGYDLDRLNETYIEYTHTMDGDVAEEFDVSTHTVNVYGWRWMGDSLPTFRGLMRERQIAAWATTGSDVLKTIPIPVGTDIRRIGVQAKTRAKTLGGTVTKIELMVNNGEYSPVTINSPMDWTMQEVSDYDLNNELGGLEYLAASEIMDLPHWFSYMQTVLAQNYGAVGQPVINVHGITLPMRLQATDATAGEAIFTMRGYGFQKCLRIGFDHEDNGADLLKSSGFGALDLQLTEAGAACDAAVFYQDIIGY